MTGQTCMMFPISCLSITPELSVSYSLKHHSSFSSIVLASIMSGLGEIMKAEAHLAATRSMASRNSLKSRKPLLSESRVLGVNNVRCSSALISFKTFLLKN